MKLNNKHFIAFFSFDVIVILFILYYVTSDIKTYEQGEEINDNGNLITVIATKRIEHKKDTTNGDNFLILLDYVASDEPMNGEETELFLMENSEGDQSPMGKILKKGNEQIWTNINVMKNYNGELFLLRMEAPDSDSIVYRVKLEVE